MLKCTCIGKDNDATKQGTMKGVKDPLPYYNSTLPGNAASKEEEDEDKEEEEDKLVARLDGFNEYAEAATKLQRLMSDGFLNLILCRR